MHARSRSTIGIVLAVAALAPVATVRIAFGAWPQFGRAICTAPEGQMHASSATDGAGGAIIAWQDQRSPRINIFAQHVLASGDVDSSWPTDGRALLADPLAMATADGGQNSPKAVSDAAGGAIVVWQDNRDPVTGTDLYAQHVSASGDVDAAWPANGAPLCVFAGLQNTLAVVPDGTGGVIATWVDTRAGGDEFDIYAQHLGPSGLVAEGWPASGQVVCDVIGPQGFPAITGDGAGGAIIAWHDLRAGSVGFDVYAQHVLSEGGVDPEWPVNGHVVCDATGDQGRVSLTSDGAGGAVLAWSDSRIVATSHIFAQHLLASGTLDPCWPTDGRALSGAALFESRPLVVSDGNGGAVVTWQGYTVQLNMFAQHVTAAGTVDPAWPTGGRALSDRDRWQTQAAIVADGAGGAVVAWRDTLNIVALHVLASGALDPDYPDTGRVMNTPPGPAGEPVLVATGGAGAIVAWTDGRNHVDADIYAAQVLAGNTLDVPDEPSPVLLLQAAPNPSHCPLSLRFAIPRDGRVILTVYDVTGRQVRKLVTGEEGTGEHTVFWDLRDESGRSVTPGVYFARLDFEGQSMVRKLVALD